MSWASLQLAIGYTCRADKWRAGEGWFTSWWREGRGNVWGPALPCQGLQEKVMLWWWAHKCRLVYNAGLAVCPSSFLPCLLHHLPLTKLAGILPGGWMKKKTLPKESFSLHSSCLAFVFAFLVTRIAMFLHPTDIRVPPAQNPEMQGYGVPRMTGQSCDGGKSYKEA